MRRWLLGLLVTACLSAVLQAPSALAHVLVPDTTGSKAAILHILPDDDPIAGEVAQLFYDVQGGVMDDKTAEARLRVTGPAGTEETVGVYADGSQLNAIHIFPRQGTYELTLSITTASDTYEFFYTQRVTRGIAGSALDDSGHAWAQLLLVASLVSFAFLIIVIINRRDAIAKYSRF